MDEPSWYHRRVLRSLKNLFQSRTEVEGAEEEDGEALVVDAGRANETWVLGRCTLRCEELLLGTYDVDAVGAVVWYWDVVRREG